MTVLHSTACALLSVSAKQLGAPRLTGASVTSRNRPFTALRRPRHSNLSCRANEEPPWVRQESTSTESDKSGSDNKSDKVNPQDVKGRRTAIIAGFISVSFGVLYLLLVSLLDSRGSTLQPPPPEAFGL